MYFAYVLIDKGFTFLDWYANPQLGHDITVIPTNGDIWLIGINTVISSIVAFYALYKIKEKI